MEKREMMDMLAEFYGFTRNADYARFFGITPQTALARRKNNYIDFEEVYARCPEVSPDWLLSHGEGPMLRSERGEVVNNTFNSGDNVRQRVYNNNGDNTKTVVQLTALLQKEQEALSKAQEQISGLIALLAKQ